jgi:hypothetical protein
MKRPQIYLILIFILSLLPFIITFTNPNLLHTSDGGVHLPRMGAYYKALEDGHIPVRWAGDLNYGYGMPLFNFMYPLPYFLTSGLISTGLGLVISFKLALWLSYVLSGIFMYMFIREFLGNDEKAFVVSVFYLYAPFRLVELLVRGALGGVFAYTFLPLVLFGIVRINKKLSVSTIALTAIAVMLLVLSHNSLSLVFAGICVLFTLFFAANGKTRIAALTGIFLGLCLAAFYWMPALLEHKYTYGDLFMKDLYLQHFPPLVNLFIPNLTDAARFRTAEISVQLGMFHILAVILAVIFLFLKKKTGNPVNRKLIIFSAILILGSIFFMERISLILWQRISLLRQFQFPWRLLAVTSFATSLLSVMFFEFPKIAKPKILVSILILTVITTAFYWYPPEGFDKVKEADFWNYPLDTTYFGETNLIWAAGPAKSYPPSRIQVIGGTATVSGLIKKTQIHTFSVSAATEAKLVDNTQYFPGWRVFVDATQVPIEFQDVNWRGLITFEVPKGTHQVRVIFGESKIRLISDIITVITGTGLLLSLGFITLKRK